MKILLITYTFSPDLTPRAFRWRTIVEEMTRLGHEVHVLCATPKGDIDDATGIKVYRVADGLLGRKSGSGVLVAGGSGENEWAIKKFLLSLIKIFWRLLYWPDYAMGWVFPGIRAAINLQKTHKYEWVISSSHPFSGHLVGLGLIKCFPDLKWLVDISDPYSQMLEPRPYNRVLYQCLSHRKELDVLARANIVTVTTQGAFENYKDTFPCIDKKIYVIPAVLSLPKLPLKNIKINKSIKLLFVGTLYKKIRNPNAIFRCLEILLKNYPDLSLELHFYGAINDCRQEFEVIHPQVKKITYLHGLVSRKEVLQAMIDADVLINIGNISKTQLASKVIEYMAVGKPIWNIISINNDPSIITLKSYYGAYHLNLSNLETLNVQIDGLAEFLKNPPVISRAHIDKICKQYLPESITKEYLDLMGFCSP